MATVIASDPAGKPEDGAEMSPETNGGDAVLWTPPRERVEASRMYDYQRWLARTRGVETRGYRQLHDWSVRELDAFWDSIWEYFDVIGDRGDGPVRTGTKMPDITWFAGATCNYAENIFRRVHTRPDVEALVGLHEDERRESLTWRELAGRVGALAAWLREHDVKPGDTVCAVLPNIPQAVEAMLACATVGAVWSVVGPDFGLTGIADRFAQLEAKVLITVDGYLFNGKHLDMRSIVPDLRQALPSIEHHILIDQLGDELEARELAEGTTLHSAIVADPVDPVFEPVDFSHPLWVLYSSGTTGKPKGIVHGHGGVTIEALKANALQYDFTPDDRCYMAVATTWVVWNLLVNIMTVGATIITYDGSPVAGVPDKQFEILERERATSFGTGAAILTLVQKSGLSPAARYNLSALRKILSTGSPLPESTWDWIYQHVHDDIHLGSDSGGTDIASGFIGSNPYDPVVRGHLQGAYLGVDAQAFDSHGQPVTGELGEFVVTQPMPSMPVFFWNDPDGSRYREAYFDAFPGVWRHGDWVTHFDDGSFIIHGRSDSTINRGGIRMGSADICQVVDAVDGVQSSMVIGAELGDGDYYMPLFVVPAVGHTLTDELRATIVTAIREQISPRYVPDETIEAPAVPTTRTGKVMEVPIKRIFQGAAPESINRATAAEPQVLDWYIERASAFARDRR